jgi:hypothetical protein
LEPLDLSFTLTREDYSRVIRAFTLRQPLFWIIIVGLGLVTGYEMCAMLGAVASSLAGGRLATGTYSPLSLLICTGFYLFFPVYLLLLRPYLDTQRIKKHEDKLKQITWVMDDYHLHIAYVQMKSEVEWAVFDKAVETKQYYLLIHAMNKRAFQFIPKRAFESPEQEASFRRYVEKYVGPIK